MDPEFSIEQKRQFLADRTHERVGKMFSLVKKGHEESITFDDVLASYGAGKIGGWSEAKMAQERKYFDEADKDKDGVLLYEELYAWVLQEVKDYYQ